MNCSKFLQTSKTREPEFKMWTLGPVGKYLNASSLFCKGEVSGKTSITTLCTVTQKSTHSGFSIRKEEPGLGTSQRKTFVTSGCQDIFYSTVTE